MSFTKLVLAIVTSVVLIKIAPFLLVIFYILAGGRI